MKKRWITAMLSIVMAGVLICGCEKEAVPEKEEMKTETKKDGSLVIPVMSDITGFTTLGTGDLTGDILCACYDYLYTVKDAETTDFYVAENCEISEDGLVYTVKLNEGIRWHDGEDLNADDLIFTINEADPYGYLPYFAAGPVEAKKVDDYTVNVELQKPSSGFYQRLGTIRVMPQHLFEGVAPEELDACDAAQKGIGMGAYKLVEWKKGESIEFERNEDYYRGSVPFDKIIYKIMPDRSAQQIAFDKGEVDVLWLADKTNLDKYREDSSCTILELKENRVTFLVVNASSANVATEEQREAIFAAINRDEIIDQVYGDETLASPAGGMYVDGTKYFDTNLENYEFNAKEAAKLAKSSGLADKTINLYYSTDRVAMEDVAMVIQQQLKSAGINCEIIGKELMGWYPQWSAGDPTIDILLNGWDSMQGNPGFEWAIYADGSGKASVKFSDDTIDILNKANTSLSEEDLEENWQAFQLSCKEDYWADPLIDTNYVLAIKKGNKPFETEQPSTYFFEDYIKDVK